MERLISSWPKFIYLLFHFSNLTSVPFQFFLQISLEINVLCQQIYCILKYFLKYPGHQPFGSGTQTLLSIVSEDSNRL